MRLNGDLAWKVRHIILITVSLFELVECKDNCAISVSGRCDRGSPCEQLCYELHDGMYECDCKAGFILRADGYSCYGKSSWLENYGDLLRRLLQTLKHKKSQKGKIRSRNGLFASVVYKYRKKFINHARKKILFWEQLRRSVWFLIFD